MKKAIVILAIVLAASCSHNIFCPYTSNIIYWTNRAAMIGLEGIQTKQLLDSAIKHKNTDSIAFYTKRGIDLVAEGIEAGDSVAYYFKQCGQAGYDTAHPQQFLLKR